MAAASGQIQKLVKIVLRIVDEGGKAAANVVKNLKDTEKQANSAGKATDDYAKKQKKASDSTKNLADKTGALMAELGSLAAVAASIAFPVLEAAKFERAMSEVKAISGATDAEFKALTGIAREMGRTTEYTAIQAADGLKYLSMAGLTATQSVTALPSVLKLAQAGALDLGEAADITTNIMTGFGMSADELGGATNVLAATFTTTNSTLGELGYGMSYVAPIAAGLGADFKDVTAAMGLLHNAGIKASMAGTSLRGVLDTLFNPTKQEAELLKELAARLGKTALATTDAAGKFIGFEKVIEQLEKAGVGGAEALKLFGQRAGPGIAALLSQGSAALKAQKKYYEDHKDIIDKISKTMTDNAVGAFRELGSAVSGLGIEIGNKLLPIVVKLLDTLTELVTDITNVAQKFPETTRYVTLAAAAVATYVIATKAAAISTALFGTSVVTNIIQVQSMSRVLGVMRSATFSVGTALSAIAVLGAAAFTGWKIGEAVGDMQAFGVTINGIAQMMWGEFFITLNEIGGWFEKVANKATAAWANMISGLLQDVMYLVDKLGAIPGIGKFLGLDEQGSTKAALQGLIDEYNQMAENAIADNARVEASVKRVNDMHNINIESIRREEQASVLAAQKKELQEKIVSETLQAQKDATEEVNKKISEQQKVLTAATQSLSTHTEQFDRLKESAVGSLEEIGRAIDANIKLISEEETIAGVTGTLNSVLGEIQRYEESKKQLIVAGSEDFYQSAESRAAAEAQVQEEIRGLEMETLELRKQAYEAALDVLEKSLEEGLDAEKKITDEKTALIEKVADARLSGEEKIKKLRQSQMSEEEKYASQLSSVQEKYAAASRIMATDTEGAIALIKEAMSEAANLKGEVADGNEVLVSAGEATDTAIKNVEQGMALLGQAEQTRTASLDKSLEGVQKHNNTLRKNIKDINGDLDGTKDKLKDGMALNIVINMGDYTTQISEVTKQKEIVINASTEFEKAGKDLRSLQDKKVELEETARIEIEAKHDSAMDKITKLENSLGGLKNNKVTVTIDSDVQKAQTDVDNLAYGIESLDDEAAAVELLPVTAEVRGAEDVGGMAEDIESLPDGVSTTATFEGDSALAEIERVKAALESIPTETTTKHNVEFTGTASPEKPLMETLGAVTQGIEDVTAKASVGAMFRVNFDSSAATQGTNNAIAEWEKMIAYYSAEVAILEAEAREQTEVGFGAVGLGAIAEGIQATYDAALAEIDRYQTRIDNLNAQQVSVNFDQTGVQNAEEALDSFIGKSESIRDAYDSVLGDLRDRFDDLGSRIRDINSEIAGEAESTDQILESINQATMTDEEKFYRQKELYAQTYENAVAAMQAKRYEEAEEGFRRARELASQLAQEVTDEQGEAILTLEQTSEMAKSLVINASKGVSDALTQQKELMVTEQQEVRDQIGQTQETVNGLTGMLEHMSEIMAAGHTITIDTSDAETKLKGLEDQLKVLEAFTVAPTTATTEIPGSGEPMNAGGEVGSQLIQTTPGEWYFGKSVVDKVGVGAMNMLNKGKKFAKKFAGGGRIPGSTVTDSVNMLAETGGYVIKRSAAQGNESFLSALANYPSRMAELLNSGQMIPKFADGGSVGGNDSTGFGTLELSLGGDSVNVRGEKDKMDAFLSEARRQQLRRPQRKA